MTMPQCESDVTDEVPVSPVEFSGPLNKILAVAQEVYGTVDDLLETIVATDGACCGQSIDEDLDAIERARVFADDIDKIARNTTTTTNVNPSLCWTRKLGQHVKQKKMLSPPHEG